MANIVKLPEAEGYQPEWVNLDAVISIKVIASFVKQGCYSVVFQLTDGQVMYATELGGATEGDAIQNIEIFLSQNQ